MNRLDQLTLKFADATLTDAEAEELLALIEGDQVARDRHQQLLDVEFALREQLSLDALRHRVLSALDDEHRAEFTERTMSQIRAMSPPHRRRRSPAAHAPILAMAASIALVAVVVYFLFNATPTIEPSGAWITAEGEVSLRQGDATIRVTGKAAVNVGATIEVMSGYAVLGYDGETTRLQLTAGTMLTANAPVQGKRFLLSQGAVQASIAPQPVGQPLVMTTPGATTTVKGTNFQLRYEAPKTTLTVSEGAVELLANNGDRALVEAGRIAEYVLGQPLIERWLNEPTGKVGHWTFDAADERRLLNATGGPVAVAARPPSLIEGKLGAALAIDENQYVEIPHSSSYELPAGSISFWFQSQNPHRGMSQMLFSKRTRVEGKHSLAGFVYLSINEEGHIHAQMYSLEGVEAFIESREPVGADQWYHVTLNFGPDGMRLYLNGQFQGEHPHAEGLAYPETGIANRQPILLGIDGYWAKRTPMRNHFLGAIDDVRLYHRPLTQAEIAQLALAR